MRERLCIQYIPGSKVYNCSSRRISYPKQVPLGERADRQTDVFSDETAELTV